MNNNEIIDGTTGEIIDVDTPADDNLTTNTNIVISDFDRVLQPVVSQRQFSILSGKTPTSVIKKRPGKGGSTWSYIPHGYVIAKLNEAFGFDYDFRILPNANGELFTFRDVVMGTIKDKNGRDQTVQMRPASIMVIGELTVRLRNPKNVAEVISTIVKTGIGEKEVIRGITWGGLVKSAASDALKRAALMLGIGLDLYWQDPDAESEEVANDPRLARVRELQAQGKTASEIADLTGISKSDVRNLME